MTKTKPVSNEPANGSEVIIRSYPAALCREHKKDGRTFHTLSFRFRDAWASIILPPDSISSSSEGRVDILLGREDDVKFASIADGENYKSLPMFCSSIRKFISENKQNYLKSIAI